MFVKSQLPVTLSILTGFPQLPQIVPKDTPLHVAMDLSEEEANRKVWQDIARRSPTESCGRILRGVGQQKGVAG